MSGAGSMYKKRYWELYARNVINTQTAGIASCDIEKELHSIVCFVYLLWWSSRRSTLGFSRGLRTTCLKRAARVRGNTTLGSHQSSSPELAREENTTPSGHGGRLLI